MTLPMDLWTEWQTLGKRHRRATADVARLLRWDKATGNVSPELLEAAREMTAAGDAATAFWRAHIAPRLRENRMDDGHNREPHG
jgi:hypothetical protein